MASISLEELQHYRKQLSDYPDAGAKTALDTIEKYNGDIEAAFTSYQNKMAPNFEKLI